jgi:hypothetical protein
MELDRPDVEANSSDELLRSEREGGLERCLERRCALRRAEYAHCALPPHARQETAQLANRSGHAQRLGYAFEQQKSGGLRALGCRLARLRAPTLRLW